MGNDDEIEATRKEWEEEEESLQHRLATARQAADMYKEQATASLPIEKARELTGKVEEIASRKTQLEDKLMDVRRQLLRNQAETEEFKLRAHQAQELMEEMREVGEDSEAPRRRLFDMAKKLSDEKLMQMRHKRDLEIAKEEYAHLLQAKQTGEKEIERLQREHSQAEQK